MSIALEHVTKRYGDHAVVRDVTLEIASGELCVLLGPSGSGKSTLLRIVAGLTEPDSGRVRLGGKDVTRVSPQKREIGFVFQHYALFRHMTVAENVEFALKIRRADKTSRTRRREELLEMVGLAGLGGRRPWQLSGGQQQRVALARALAHQPSVLLLDEPFGALDARIRSDLRRTVREIQRGLSITTVFVTHDQEEAFELADRIAVVDRGRVLEHGAPREIYLHPRTEFTATFLGSANLLIGQVAERGVRVGHVEIAAGSSAISTGDAHRVQVLFRPEDVAVKTTADALRWPSLGTGVIESRSFLGPLERLRVRLPMRGVRAVAPEAPFGEDSIVVEATRSQHQARRFPLEPGDTAFVGLRRIHTLAHPGIGFLVMDDREETGPSAVALGVALATAAKTRALVVRCGDRAAEEPAPIPLRAGEGSPEIHRIPEEFSEAVRLECERALPDLVVVGAMPKTGADVASDVLSHGRHHVLVAPPGASVPKRILICSAAGEPGKGGIRFAGRLGRHLGAEVTVLSVLVEESPTARAQIERHLAACARTVAPLGVTARTRVRQGEVEAEIRSEAEDGAYDLIVVGSPLGEEGRAPALGGPVASLLDALTRPVLVVRYAVDEV
jgi:sulfate transport system ATP-binding protein